tara:strand:+ start:977 stop:1189 length:213 start_codon:yes stop_codon:yes gene_type:complete
MKEEFSIVEENPNLIRDNHSKAIINTDTEAYEAYIKRKKIILEKDKVTEDLRQEVSELKDLVKELIKKIG